MKRCSTVLLFCLLFFLVQPVLLFSAPFDRRISFTQPDGGVIALHGWGDEFHATFETLDGYTVVFDCAAQAYVYARISADGTLLEPSTWIVGRDDPQKHGVRKHLRGDPKTVKEAALKRFERWNTVTRNSARWQERKRAVNLRLNAAASTTAGAPVALSPPAFTVTGSKVGLCLLIDFDDDTNTIPHAEIVNFCNGENYTGYGNNGSVKKYYQDNSNNLLTYTNIVTAYIRIPNSLHPKSYYNDTTKDCGDQGNLLIRDALAILKALPNYATEIAPAFSSLTRDANGYVTACNVFYAGGNGDVWSYGLWPHSWSLYNVGPQTLVSGVSVYDYQVTNIGSSLELGTFCHENGHMLCGYPDIYDYDYDSVGGAGMFCLMNSGGHGLNPVQICAYLKRASGWATTVELTSSSQLTASVASSGVSFNRFYRYAKPGVSTEYFLVENRNRSGRDANIPASGIAIWHIDELGDKDNQSMAYSATHAHYEVTLVQADNLWHFQNYANFGDANDLFCAENSAAGYINQFNDQTAPSARWWDGSLSQLNWRTFSSAGTAMTFAVVPVSTPTISTAATLPSGWTAVPYTLTFSANGGSLPYVWAVVSNTLPEGLILTAEGTLSGTPRCATNSAFAVRVMSANGESATNTCTLSISDRATIPFSEGFESGGSMPAGWSQDYLTNTLSWSFKAGGYSGHPAGAHGGSYNAYLFVAETTPNVTRLVSPYLDFGGMTRNAMLRFWQCMTLWTPDQDHLRVYYKAAPTNAWALLAEYTSSVSTWTQRSLSLPNPGRASRIAFVGVAQYGYGVCIDDVSVTATSSAYSTWQTNRFTAVEMVAGAITGDTADPDGDGIANLLEYAQGLDPRSPDATPWVWAGIRDGFMMVNYRQNKQASDVVYAMESSTNLAQAVWSTNAITEVSRFDSNTWWSVTIKHDTPITNAPSRMMRLNVGVQ